MITVHADTLFKVVERNKRSFERMIFWRDVLEVGGGIAVAMAAAFFAKVLGCGWPFYVLAVSAVWYVGFMVVDRIRQGKNVPALSEPLSACINASIRQVNHQIWLSKNVVRCCLLPVGIGLLFAFCDIVYLLRPRSWIDIPVFLATLVLCAAVLRDVYRNNERAVREEFQPRKRELEALLNSLKLDEA
jgi:hypothetical protein